MAQEKLTHYQTNKGLHVTRSQVDADYEFATDEIVQSLDQCRGVFLSSSFEFPGRYQRWDVGFINPPLMVTSRRRQVDIQALNERGEILLSAITSTLDECDAIESVECTQELISCLVKAPEPLVFEETRSRQHSVFSVLRKLIDFFGNKEDPHLGFYGAFGYELAYQFEAVVEAQNRSLEQRDMVLYLPDELVVVDHQKEDAFKCRYDFRMNESSTVPLRREGNKLPFVYAQNPPKESCDHAVGEYAQTVETALNYFKRGDLFETVPGQMFYETCRDSPSTIFLRLREQNPAPYGALINLGDREYLVSASPEMYVRVKDGRVETCPISGTIARGANPLEDAEQIRTLLNSEKDLAELSMCTDVDRNDKARVCVPGTVKVIGRRQVEMYSRLIHTVDHVEGQLKPEFDALDAFLSHAWAVTVTGAPKQAAIQFIEDHEKSPRRWYGGAMGFIGFNGNMNTGLTLRTMRIENGVAEVRAGATLLSDSDPEAEEQETRLKASALLRAIRNEEGINVAKKSSVQLSSSDSTTLGAGVTILMVDHQDSFVHSLTAYFQAQGARVRTVRPENVEVGLQQVSPDLVVLSPGPGLPEDFQLSETIKLVLDRKLPLFGVCLGLQGLVEYFGGSLQQLANPMHGKPSILKDASGFLFKGVLGESVEIGRYHSLIADTVPDDLLVTARSEDGVVMAVEHCSLPISAVQFHPESILSMKGDIGQVLISNVLASLNREA